MLPAVGYKSLCSTFSPEGICCFDFFQYDEVIYLNDCVILGRLASNRMDVYFIFQYFYCHNYKAIQTNCLKYISKN